MTSDPSLIFCFRHVFSPFILLHLCNSSFLPKFPLLTARPMHIYLEIHFKFYLFNGASPDSHLIVELTPILWDPMCGSDFCHNALILALIFFWNFLPPLLILRMDAISYFFLFPLQISDTALTCNKCFLKRKMNRGMMIGTKKISILKWRIDYLALFNPGSLVC